MSFKSDFTCKVLREMEKLKISLLFEIKKKNIYKLFEFLYSETEVFSKLLMITNDDPDKIIPPLDVNAVWLKDIFVIMILLMINIVC